MNYAGLKGHLKLRLKIRLSQTNVTHRLCVLTISQRNNSQNVLGILLRHSTSSRKTSTDTLCLNHVPYQTGSDKCKRLNSAYLHFHTKTILKKKQRFRLRRWAWMLALVLHTRNNTHNKFVEISTKGHRVECIRLELDDICAMLDN